MHVFSRNKSFSAVHFLKFLFRFDLNLILNFDEFFKGCITTVNKQIADFWLNITNSELATGEGKKVLLS